MTLKSNTLHLAPLCTRCHKSKEKENAKYRIYHIGLVLRHSAMVTSFNDSGRESKFIRRYFLGGNYVVFMVLLN